MYYIMKRKTNSHLFTQLKVSGYDHKIGMFFDYILKFLVNFSSAGNRFEDIKEAYVRNLKNWKDEDPSTHASDYLNNLLSSHSFTNDELLACVDGM